MNDNVAEAMNAQTEDAQGFPGFFPPPSHCPPPPPPPPPKKKQQRMKTGGAIANSFSFINYYLNIYIVKIYFMTFMFSLIYFVG